MLYSVFRSSPRAKSAQKCWVAPNAAVIGDVWLGLNSSVWFAATVRGDNERIVIGDECNIQDGAVLHTDKGVSLRVADRVTVGHMAVLHGCRIGTGTLIGIGAVVLNGAEVGRNCLIGARALITENKNIPSGSVVMGVPAKVVRKVTAGEVKQMQRIAAGYVLRARRYMKSLEANALTR